MDDSTEVDYPAVDIPVEEDDAVSDEPEPEYQSSELTEEEQQFNTVYARLVDSELGYDAVIEQIAEEFGVSVEYADTVITRVLEKSF